LDKIDELLTCGYSISKPMIITNVIHALELPRGVRTALAGVELM
jgi:hypothetical protein